MHGGWFPLCGAAFRYSAICRHKPLDVLVYRRAGLADKLIDADLAAGAIPRQDKSFALETGRPVELPGFNANLVLKIAY